VQWEVWADLQANFVVRVVDPMALEEGQAEDRFS
jgi:hypothetical protein